MTAWWVLVAAPCAAVAARRWRAARRGSHPGGPVRVRAGELGLDQFPPGGALVQFSNPSPPSRVSLNRLAEAAAHHKDQVTVVELPAHGHAASRMRVHAAPTVLFVDASGGVVRRWTRPPERSELEALLRRGDQAPVAAGSM